MSKLYLPDMGNDWIRDCTGKYIILSLKHSTPEFSMFWLPDNCGYTTCLANAGRYDRSLVLEQINYYNDGVNTIAVPLTVTALNILGIATILADYKMIDAFLTIEKVAETQE